MKSVLLPLILIGSMAFLTVAATTKPQVSPPACHATTKSQPAPTVARVFNPATMIAEFLTVRPFGRVEPKPTKAKQISAFVRANSAQKHGPTLPPDPWICTCSTCATCNCGGATSCW